MTQEDVYLVLKQFPQRWFSPDDVRQELTKQGLLSAILPNVRRCLRQLSKMNDIEMKQAKAPNFRGGQPTATFYRYIGP